MKRIFVFPTLLIIVVSLACQLPAQPAINETEGSPLPQEIATQPIVNTENPLVGLVYSVYDEENKNEIWQIDDDGKTHMLLPNHYYGMLSPDGKQFVYYDKSYGSTVPCTWLTDFGTNETRSLDCYMGGDSLPAYILGWIPSQPDTLLAILDRSGGGMGGASGFLGTISIKAGDKEILDSDHYIQSAQISPNRDMVAYGADDFPLSGWLYSWNSGVTAFNPQDYGIDYSQIGSPVWSPDGTKIVWGLMDNEFNSAIGVFDLDKKTAKVLHPFKQEMRPDLRPTPPSLLWSPNGQWFIVEIYEIDSRQDEWWILSMDGETEYKTNGEFNSWSPDGQWLVTVTNNNELNVSRLDGSDTVKLGEVNYAYDGGNSLWSKDAQYLAFIGADKKIRFAKVGEWKVNEVTNIETASFLLDWNSLIPSFYEPAEISPTATSVPDFSCPNAPTTRLQKGDKARTTFTDGSTTRLRSAPEAGNNGIDNLPEGTEFEIVGGPVCYPRPDRNDAYVYWEILVPSRNNIKGWVAEGDLNSYYIEPLK